MDNERIEQAAEEYFNQRKYPFGLKDLETFHYAANYALSHQWISVDEELPPYEYVLTCQDDNGNVQSVAIEIYQDGKWCGVDDEVTDREPDYWMPIPSFSKEKKWKI